MFIAWLFLGLTALYFGGMFLFSGGMGLPVDDAYIHLRFAQHLVTEGQMAFNAGVPSSGSSAPAYPMLVALWHLVFKNYVVATYALGFAATLTTLVFVFLTLRDVTQQLALARFGTLLCLLVPPTFIQAYMGMESAVYTTVFAAGLYCYGREQRVWASLLFALNMWLRPEMMLMAPLMLLEWATAPGREPPRGMRALGHVAAWTLSLAGFVAFNYRLDGHLLPSTFSAKAVNSYGGLLPSWFIGLPAAVRASDLVGALRALAFWPLLMLVSLAFTFTVNAAPALRQMLRAFRARHRAGPTIRLATLCFFAFPMVRGLVDPVGVVPLQFERYYAHLTLCFVYVVCFALAEVESDGAQLRRRMRWMLGWSAGGFLLTAVVALAAVSNINTMQVAMANFIRTRSSPSSLIAVNDIGAMAFIGDRRVLDLVGLVEPALVTHRRLGGSTADYVRARDPEWVVIFPTWYPELASQLQLEPVHSITLDLNVVCGSDTMVAYRRRPDS